jgi:hypothetical protein
MTSFRVYIDESGDEGFVFNADGTGSSRWMTLSAVITRTATDLETVKLVDEVRNRLGRAPKTPGEPKHPLHFRDLRHEQRLPFMELIGKARLMTVNVLIHKPSIREPEKFQNKSYLLYRYATRYLVERVSWCCRDHRKTGEGDGTAELIFSNRSNMSYDDLRKYLQYLEAQTGLFNVQIDWSVIKATQVRAINHDQSMGLQVADAVASGFFFGINQNRYGHVEPRYVQMMSGRVYCYKGTHFGYGVKFFPRDVAETLKGHPELDWMGKCFK